MNRINKKWWYDAITVVKVVTLPSSNSLKLG